MMVVIEASVIYPVVVVKVNNIACMALIDSDAAIFYASSALLVKLNPVKMMMHSIIRKIDVIEVISVEISRSSHK